MTDFTIEETASAVGAEDIIYGPSGNAGKIRNVTTDSRSVPENAVFFALRGERFDGHDFIKAVSEKAVCVVAEKKTECLCPLIIVKDSLKALGMLAAKAAEISRSRGLEGVIGVTGSVGKTTTKEFLRSVLSEGFETYCSQGNHNNHIGLPLSLCSIPENTRYMISEMGMSARGEIEYLSSVAKPDIAVITNIGVSHIEKLGSREEIRCAKLEILSHMKKGSLVVLRGDEPLLKDEYSKKALEGFDTVYFGFSGDCGVRAVNVRSFDDHVTFDAVTEDGGVIRDVLIPAAGEHYIADALPSVAVASRLGMSPDAIKKGLASFHTTGMRQKIYFKNGVRVIADCYNASPESMAAALKVLSSSAGRKIAVLADMLELGSVSDEAHSRVGQLAAKSADVIFAFGEKGALICESAEKSGMAPERIRRFETKNELSLSLKAFLREGDTVLFKASRGMALEDVIAGAELAQ